MHFISRTVLSLVLCCSMAIAASASPPLELAWENIFLERGGVSSAVLSPDGERAAVVGDDGESEGIFLVSVADGSSTFWLEGGSPAWFADGKRIVFTRDGDLWVASVGSTAAQRLTEDDLDERAPRPSPDMRWVAFYSGRSGHQDIWVIPADGSAAPRQVTNASMTLDDARYAPSWSPNSKQIAYFSNKSDYWEDDVWLVDVASGRERQISRSLMARSTPVWSPDGKRIAVMGTNKAGFWYHDLVSLFVLRPASGEERELDMQVYATERGDPAWSENGDELFFPYHERGEIELWRVPASGGVATRVSNMGGSFRSYDAALSSSRSGFVFVRSTALRGSEVDYLPLEGGTARRLTHFSRDWEGLVEPEEVSYRSWDGLYIQGFLFRPPGFDSEREYPTLVMVHGGGTNSYYKRLSLVEQALASRGYVVLAVNYRGGSGFGRVFQDLGVNDWGNGQAKDAASAADFIRAQPWSSGKVGIYGYSYGGITTMAAITRVPDAFDAAVPMAGIYDFGDAYTNADRIGKVFIRTGHGGSPEERAEIYAISNALSRVENIETPLLIMHGEADVRAPFRQYELAVEILEREGKVFESKSYPGEPHGFRNPHNRIDMYQRLEAWFDKYLR
jgi:dipeptidyl aminopeptidase/acylaminoacyl peptidase